MKRDSFTAIFTSQRERGKKKFLNDAFQEVEDCQISKIAEGNEGGEDNMGEVMGNPTDEETPVAEEEEAMADDDMM